MKTKFSVALIVLLGVLALLSGYSVAAGPTTTESTDVVIIGAGGAGMVAAITAHDAGAKVILLEKMAMVGGNSLFSSGGMNAAGTKYQKALGIKDSPELFFNDTMKGGYYLNNPALVWTLATKSSDAVDWVGTLGLPLSQVGRTGGSSVNRAHTVQGGYPIGAAIVPVLKKAVTQRKIDLRLRNPVTDLITDATGAVTGVKVAGRNGQAYTIMAKSVIVASGGFGANLDMVVKYNPKLKGFQTTNAPGITGDGMVMAEKIGARLVDMEQIQIHPTTIPKTGYLISEATRGAGAILVNHQGKRFINELQTRDVVSKAILALPEQTAFLLFDNSVRKSLALLEDAFKMRLVLEGDSLAELAQKMKVDPETLSATVATYNKAAEAKKDPEFNRPDFAQKINPPKYYAIEIMPGIHHTMGGIKINTQTEVINKSGDVIPNLYAAGEVTGGVHGGNRLGGNAVADYLVFGRIAGANAAQNAAAK